MHYLIILFSIFYSAISSAEGHKCNIQFDKTELCAEVKFLGEMGRKSDAKFEIRFYENNKLVKLAKDPSVHLWMTMKNGHEHGSEKLKMNKNEFVYSFSNAWFLMLGQWHVIIEIDKLGKKFTGKLPICIKKVVKSSYIGLCGNN